MLKKAYVEITNRCNLACSFCPKTRRAPRTFDVPRGVATRPDLSWEPDCAD